MPGVKHDGDKIRYDLLPPEFLHGVADILTFGAKKYEARNWERGIAYSRVFGALMRHLWAWWAGKDLDDETGKSHLWHAGCCLAFLITYEARGMGGYDDRSPYGGQARDNVLPVDPQAPPEQTVPAQDVQPVRSWARGPLVFGRDGGFLDRVEMVNPPQAPCDAGDPWAYAPAEYVAGRTK